MEAAANNGDRKTTVIQLRIPAQKKVCPDLRVPIYSPRDLAQVIRKIYGKYAIGDREIFAGIYLNSANVICHHAAIHVGGRCYTQVDIPLFFREAVEKSAVNAISVHNHPSGNYSPSAEDKNLWRALVDAGKTLHIAVYDNCIMVENGVYSERAGQFFPWQGAGK